MDDILDLVNAGTAGIWGPNHYSTMYGPIAVHNNTGGIMGALVDALDADAVTLGPGMIVSTIEAEKDPDLMKHEFGHVAQNVVLGPGFLAYYGAAYVGTALFVGADNGAIHRANPMETSANWIKGKLPW